MHSSTLHHSIQLPNKNLRVDTVNQQNFARDLISRFLHIVGLGLSFQEQFELLKSDHY